MVGQVNVSEDVDSSSNERIFPLWYHPIYTNGIHPDARFPRDRYELLLERLTKSTFFSNMEIHTPRMIDKENLLLAHEDSYIDRFFNNQLTDKERKRIGLTPWTESMIERTSFLVGGAMEATHHAIIYGGITGNMAGGTHHAHREFGSGYCVFNDLAICALDAVNKQGIERVAILDLDVHQGDGTATILEDEKKVLTISVHCEKNFPFRKESSDHDLVLPSEAADEEYLKAVRKALQICIDFQPNLVLFQAGVDGLKTDALGKLNVSRKGMRMRNQMVFDTMMESAIPLVIFMGGGYAKPIDHSLDAFFDLFADAVIWNNKWTNKKQCKG